MQGLAELFKIFSKKKNANFPKCLADFLPKKPISSFILKMLRTLKIKKKF